MSQMTKDLRFSIADLRLAIVLNRQSKIGNLFLIGNQHSVTGRLSPVI
jgi:hypothetical protein